MVFQPGHRSSNFGKGRGFAFLLAHIDDPDGPCLTWPLSCDNHGYAICAHQGERFKAAALMCELVNGPKPSPKHHCAHSCGKGQEGCVHPRHVRWATPKENMADSVKLGAVRKPGTPRFKLTEDDVAKIIALKGKLPYGKIGAMFGVKGKQIGKILRGEQWKGGKRPVIGFAADPLTRERRARLGLT